MSIERDQGPAAHRGHGHWGHAVRPLFYNGLVTTIVIVTLAFVPGCSVLHNWNLGRWGETTSEPADTSSASRATEVEKEKVDGRHQGEDAETPTTTRQDTEERPADELARATELTNAAILRRANGDNAGAQSLHEQALAIRDRLLGRDHPDLAATLNNLAVAYGVEEKYAKAEPLFRRALAIRERSLGRHHRATAYSLNNLALLYAAQGRYEAAEPLYQRALTALERTAGSSRSAVAKVTENYAALLSDTGRVEQSYELEARAQAIRAENETAGD